MSTNDLTHGDAPAGLSGADLIRVLRDPGTFEHLVDRMPACPQKDLLQAWGYLQGIHPRPPWTVLADESAGMSTNGQPQTDDAESPKPLSRAGSERGPSDRGRRQATGDVDPLYALYHQEPDPEAIQLAHVLIKDPAGIPYLLEIPKPAAVPVLIALADIVADMSARLSVLEALQYVDNSGAAAAGPPHEQNAGENHDR